jgi:hypothetical protein
MDRGGSDMKGFLTAGVEKFPKAVRVFVGENGRLDGEAVAKRVEADGGAPFGSARAGAVLGVATIGVALTLGGHRVDCCGRSRDQDSAAEGGGKANLI